MPRRSRKSKHHELPAHKRDWFLTSLVIIVMIIFFVLLFGRFA